MQMPHRRGRRPEHSLRHLFIFSAIMHELPEKRLKAAGHSWMMASQLRTGRAAGMAVMGRHTGSLRGRPAPAPSDSGTAGVKRGTHMWKAPLCPSQSVPFVLTWLLFRALPDSSAAQPARKEAPYHSPCSTDGETEAGGLSDAARIWPGCPETEAALGTMAPGTGHHGPQLAGKDTEAPRTESSPRPHSWQVAGRSHAQSLGSLLPTGWQGRPAQGRVRRGVAPRSLLRDV